MKFATNLAILAGIAAMVPLAVLADGMRDNVLRQAIVRAGLVPFQETHVDVPEDLLKVGKLLFQTKDISLDRKTACASCHVDRFGSADGIANAIGTGGVGEGLDRLAGGGDIIPRNTLPFWGRGSKGFDVFLLGRQGRRVVGHNSQSVRRPGALQRPAGRRGASAAGGGG